MSFSKNFSTFASMKLETKRQLAAWVLWAVFVPMLVFSSLHVHEKSAANAIAACADCVHHSCHGHLSPTASWAHECVLCQFLNFSFLATAAVVLIYYNKVTGDASCACQRHVCATHSGTIGLRAPPTFFV